MAKPVTLPRWANVSGTVVEPSEPEKDGGFVGGGTAAASTFNWLMLWIYNWLAWLDSFFSSAGTLTLPVDQDVVISGTGEYRHGETTGLLSPMNAIPVTGGGAPTFSAGDWNLNTGYLFYPLPLKVGDRILSWAVQLNKTTGAGVTVSAQLIKLPIATGVTGESQIGVTQSRSENNPGLIALLQSGLTETVAGDTYHIRVYETGGSGDSAYGVQFTYDHP